MNLRTLLFVLSLSVATAACGSSHTDEMDAGDEITFDASFPDTGPDSGGRGAVGQGCETDTDCPASAPTCDIEFPGGYCTSFDCGAGSDCPEGSECVQVGRSTFQCLDNCDPAGTDECRAGYGCSQGMINVCLPGCEDDSDCAEGTLCEVGGGFNGSGRCYTAESTIGAACTGSEECPEATTCLDDDFGGFTGGYCIGFGCDPEAGTGCPDGAVCLYGFRGGWCYDGCETDGDCRSGYECRGSVNFPDRLTCQVAFQESQLGQVCSANRGRCDGVCLSEGGTGWPDSYCAQEGCDPDGDSSDCLGDGVCIEVATGAGICIDGCTAAGDCRAGYDCRPSDAEDPESPLACVPGCDMDSHCGNADDGFVCNTGTGLCGDPFSADALGEPCTDLETCVGGTCLSEADDGWPAGMCTYPGCRLRGEGRAATCPADSTCVDDGAGDPDLGVCAPTCTVGGTDCRPGYACALVDPEVTDGPTACLPACASDSCGGGRTCNTETGRCE